MLKKILFISYIASWLIFFGFSIARYAKIIAGQCNFFTNGWLMCAPQSQFGNLGKWGIIFLIIGVFTSFLLATRLLWKSNDQTIVFPKLKWLLVGLGLLAVFVVPLGTSDMPYYFSAGKAISQNLNPYVDVWTIEVDFANNLPDASADFFSYGPIMASVFNFVYTLSYDKVLVFMLIWKFFMLVSLVGCGLLTMKLGNLLSNSKTPSWYVLWFAIPIFLFEWVVNGHFDGVWLFFLLLTIYAAHTKRWWLMFPALAMGIWIKYIPVLLVPFFALWWWQELTAINWKKNLLQMGFGVALSGLITYFSWLPYWVGPQVFSSLVYQSKWALMSVFATIYYSLKPLFVWLLADQAHWYLTRLVQGSLLLAVIYLLYPIIKKCLAVLFRKVKLESGEYVQTIFIFLLIYFFVWQKSFWPWYVVWAIPLALIVYKANSHPYALKIGAWLSLASPIYHIISWATVKTDAISKDELWFYYLIVGSIMAYPLYLIFRWRQKDFAVSESIGNSQ